MGALSNAIRAQIDLEQNLFDLDPPGRAGTNKAPETGTTLVYCPREPDYLINCHEAAEAFVREINIYARKRDLLRPCCVTLGHVEK